jgi:hypothetical protein
MPETLEHVKRHVTNDTVARILRTVSIWEERNVFDQETLRNIHQRLEASVSKSNLSLQSQPAVQPLLPGLSIPLSIPLSNPLTNQLTNPLSTMPSPVTIHKSNGTNIPVSASSNDVAPSKQDKKVTVSVPEAAKPLLRFMNIVKRVDGEMEEPTLQIRSLPDAYFDQVGALEFVGKPEAATLTSEIDSVLTLLSTYHQRLKRKIQFEEKIMLELRVLFDKEEKAMKGARKRLDIVEQKFADAAEVRQRIAGSGSNLKLYPMEKAETVALPAMTSEEMSAMLQAAATHPAPQVVSAPILPPSPFAMQPTFQEQETNPTNVLAAAMAAQAAVQAQTPLPTMENFTFSPAFPANAIDEYDPMTDFVKNDGDEFLNAFDDGYQP